MLPKYCSEMNDVDDEWHQLKTHKIAGEMFDNNYVLAMAVVNSMIYCSQEGDTHWSVLNLIPPS